MQAELVALLSATVFGLATTITRRGLEHASVASGVLYSMLGGVLVLAPAGLLVAGVPAAPLSALVLLALSGLVGSLLGRLAVIAGVSRLGAATAGAIQGTYPLFAYALALLFLGESITPLRGVGAVLVVTGVAILMAWGRAQPARTARKGRGRRAVVFPLLAGFLYAAADAITRTALLEAPYPVFGAAVSYVCAFLAAAAGFAALPELRKQLVLTRPAIGWFLLGGAAQGLGVLGLFTSLGLGEVVQVSPIIGSQPLFVLLWSVVLLRQVEVLRRSTVVGALVVVLGVVILSLARAL
ncbi:MAG: DMT family transporter [Chloroflexi bacterium]|nr:DMT family transporter [Chloroflexota bacterium]